MKSMKLASARASWDFSKNQSSSHCLRSLIDIFFSKSARRFIKLFKICVAIDMRHCSLNYGPKSNSFVFANKFVV